MFKVHDRLVHVTLAATEIIILVDSGSTHNFISDDLVRDLNITSQFVAPFGVQIGNGNIIRCNRLCKNVLFNIGDLQIAQDFYPFSLGGADVVLGIQWLATLNTVQANWNKMFLIFTVDGQEHKLQGLLPNNENTSTFHHLIREPIWNHSHLRRFFGRLEGKSFVRVGCIDRIPDPGHLGQNGSIKSMRTGSEMGQAVGRESAGGKGAFERELSQKNGGKRGNCLEVG